jgi:hypothetical protein
MHGAQEIEGDTRMKLKTLSARARPSARARRRRASHDGDKQLRPNQPEAQHRVWSLLLPPGFPADRR